MCQPARSCACLFVCACVKERVGAWLGVTERKGITKQWTVPFPKQTNKPREWTHVQRHCVCVSALEQRFPSSTQAAPITRLAAGRRPSGLRSYTSIFHMWGVVHTVKKDLNCYVICPGGQAVWPLDAPPTLSVCVCVCVCVCVATWV